MRKPVLRVSNQVLQNSLVWVDALRPRSTAEVMSGQSVILIHTVPGQASPRQITST